MIRVCDYCPRSIDPSNADFRQGLCVRCHSEHYSPETVEADEWSIIRSILDDLRETALDRIDSFHNDTIVVPEIEADPTGTALYRSRRLLNRAMREADHMREADVQSMYRLTRTIDAYCRTIAPR